MVEAARVNVPAEKRATPEEGSSARAAGRGGLFVLVAKAFFIVTGLVQQALLPRALGLAGYGALSRVFAVANVFNNVVVSSSTQGVSRATAAAGDAHRAVLYRTLRVHGALALGLATVLAITAPLFASYQEAPYIVVPLAVMAGVLLVYGVYAPIVGYLNGRGRFGLQASLDMIAATLRTACLVGGGYAFLRAGHSPVTGATVGAVAAACGVFIVALVRTGTGERGRDDDPAVPSPKAYVTGLTGIMVAQACTNALMQADISLLGRALSVGARTLALSPALADEWVGVYRACQLFAFLPYQLLFAVTQVLFPMLAKTRAEGTRDDVATLVARGGRIGVLATGLLVTPIVLMPWSVLRLAYPAVVADRGAHTLHLLAAGQAAFALFGLATTVLVSLGKERLALATTAIAVVLVAVFCTTFAGRASFGEAQLEVVALGTTGGLVVALVAAAVLVVREAGAFIPLRSALTVLLWLVAAWTIGRFTPHLGKVVTLAMAAAVSIAYFGFLALTGAVTRDDASLVRAVIRRKKT